MDCRKNRKQASLALAIAALLMSACATTPPPPVEDEPDVVADHPPPPPPRAVAEPSIPIIKDSPPVVVEPPEVTPTLAPVAIVLTSREPAYEAVVNELGERLGDYSVYDLSDKSQPPVTAFRAINDSDVTAVIAIGLSAAKSAIALSRTSIIFSQVFNYQDHGLLTANSRGVSAIAPLDAQLAAWMDVDPTISEVGVIVGPGHDSLVEEAQQAALGQGINLTLRISHSDQETLYFYKRMIADIDGFWMLPDNRILSRRVIREILADAHRRNVAVAVPNDALLPMGAAISITTTASNVAETIVEVLRKIQAGAIADVAEMTPLSEIQVTANDYVLQKRVMARDVSDGRGTTK